MTQSLAGYNYSPPGSGGAGSYQLPNGQWASPSSGYGPGSSGSKSPAGFTDTTAANSSNASGEFLPTYGGYQAGYADTIAREQSLANQAQNAKAAKANFGTANAYLDLQNRYGKQQAQLLRPEQKLASQLQSLASGHGVSAADYGIPAQESGAIAGAQSAAAAGGSPLAERNALSGLGGSTSAIASGYGSDVAGTMAGATGQLTQQYGAEAGLLGQNAAGDIAAAQQAGQQAAFNPGLQAGQNRINDATALSYWNSLLGVQQQQGAAQNNAQAADTSYILAELQHQNQQTSQAIGAGAQAVGTAAAVAI